MADFTYPPPNPPCAVREPIALSKLQALTTIVAPSACRISSPARVATGFLCNDSIGYLKEEFLFLLVTNNHVLPDISMQSLANVACQFPSQQDIWLSAQNVDFAWTEKDLDVTIIGLTDPLVAQLQTSAHFLHVGTPVVGQQVAIIGHPGGGEAALEYGPIHHIVGSTRFWAGYKGKPGTSGSPVVLADFCIVAGIHIGPVFQSSSQAVNLKYAIELYLKDLLAHRGILSRTFSNLLKIRPLGRECEIISKLAQDHWCKLDIGIGKYQRL